MHTIRVLLADDHALVRSGIRALLELEPDVTVVGEASNGEDAVRMAEELAPDLVLMDLTMAGLGGVEATRRIVAGSSGARVLVLTMHPPGEHLISALEAGGSGYVTKESVGGELLEAVRTVAAGQVFLYPSAARLLLERYRHPRPGQGDGDPVRRLSARELEVLTRTVEGYTAAEIAERLQISPKTVDTYRQRGMEKLHLTHRSELVQFALRRGLLAVPVA